MIADSTPVALRRARHVLVYRDTASPTRFHYASTRPSVARSGAGWQLSLVHYDQVLDGKAGVLSLVVTLRPDADEMDRLREDLLEDLAGTVENPSLDLVPIAWTEGQVVAAMIDGQPVRATPSLIGDNSVTLQLELSTDQYLQIRGSHRQAVTPISVVYALSYEALRPQYGFSIQFDEVQFRDWVIRRCSANLLLLDFERTDTFEDLRQSGVLRVVNESQTDAPAPDSFKLAFMRSLQSALEPLPRFVPQGGGGDWSLGFSCSTVRETQNLARRLDTRMQVSGAVPRRAFIQGVLAGWKEALDAQPDLQLPTRSSFQQALTVRCHDAFNGEPLHALKVRLESAAADAVEHVFEGPEWPWTVELSHPPFKASPLESGSLCRVTPYFGDGSAGPVTVMPVRREQAYLDIVPASLFSWRRYQMEASPDFPWELVTAISVRLAGQGASAGVETRPPNVVLTAAKTRADIELFSPTPVDLADVVFTAECKTLAGPVIRWSGWPAGPQVYLNPFIRRWLSFRVAEDVDWQDLTAVEITLQAGSTPSHLWRDGRYSLTPDRPRCRIECWSLPQTPISYRVSYVGAGRRIPPTIAESSRADVVITLPPRATAQS